MKFLLLVALLLPLNAVASPTEEDWCAFLVPELEQAVVDEIITQEEADSFLSRCLSLSNV